MMQAKTIQEPGRVVWITGRFDRTLGSVIAKKIIKKEIKKGVKSNEKRGRNLRFPHESSHTKLQFDGIFLTPAPVVTCFFTYRNIA